MEFDYAKDVVRRSRLIMPANAPKFIEKAYLRNADAIALDLEDSVPQTEKAVTRSLIKGLIPVVGKGGSDVLVRINNTKDMLRADIAAAVWPGVAGIILPKAETAAEIRAIETMVAELERERDIKTGTIKLSVLIESAKGFINMNEIAQASERIDSLTLGNEDFLRDLGAVGGEETYHALLIPRIQLVITARAYKKVPMGLLGSLANYKDTAAFEKTAVLAYKHGYLGASCVHPGNVEALNKAFTPSAEEVERSGKIIDAFESAVAQRRASATFEGKMIDYVHHDQAKQVIARYNTIQAFELKKEKARESCC